MSSPLEFGDHPLESAQDGTQRIKFGALYGDKPAVVAFLRRLGCAICRVQAQDLESIRPQVEALGARLVCVSFEHFGEGSDADRSFQGGKYFQGDVWTDPSKGLYEGLFKRKGMFNGFYGLLDMSKDRLKEAKDRNVSGNFKGDGFRMGGVLVLGPGDKVHLDHRQSFYGDDATPADILAAVRKAVGAAPAAPGEDDAALAAAAAKPPRAAPVCENCEA